MGRPPRHPRHPRHPGADPDRTGPDLTARRGPPGTIPSPNIWHHPATYEIENRAVDPDGRLGDVLVGLAGPAGWADRVVLDLGCGTGFHLPWFAQTAARVVGVEPHAGLAAMARRRAGSLADVEVLAGTAQAIPLPDASVDVVHARWAYFFGPGCEPGLAELTRVVRRGGTALVVDNDGSRSTFGSWFRRGYPHLPDPGTIERFWSAQGFRRTPVDMGWRFASRADLEAVVGIEFKPADAEVFLAEHRAAGGGLEVDYAVNVWSRTY